MTPRGRRGHAGYARRMKHKVWMVELEDALRRGTLVRVSLGAPAPGVAAPKVLARPVTLKGGDRLQVVTRHPTRDVTQNYTWVDGLAELAARVPEHYRSIHISTTERTTALTWTGDRMRRVDGPPVATEPADTRHDRAPQRAVPPDHRWIDALGGGGKSGTVEKKRQIDHFVEVLHQWLGGASRPEGGFTRWLDVGSGSGAMTFALWHYLRTTGFSAAEVVGIELRPELAARTERVARSLGCDGLSFVAGTVEAAPAGPVDGVIALHACDVATDDALAAGVAAGARLLMVAPCCHKELRGALAPPAPLDTILRHGILKTREADLVTDALRAAALEAAGYDARVFEFVSSEHTDKNLMITGARRAAPADGAAERLTALATFYGVRHQRLADRLGLSLERPSA